MGTHDAQPPQSDERHRGVTALTKGRAQAPGHGGCPGRARRPHERGRGVAGRCGRTGDGPVGTVPGSRSASCHGARRGGAGHPSRGRARRQRCRRAPKDRRPGVPEAPATAQPAGPPTQNVGGQNFPRVVGTSADDESQSRRPTGRACRRWALPRSTAHSASVRDLTPPRWGGTPGPGVPQPRTRSRRPGPARPRLPIGCP